MDYVVKKYGRVDILVNNAGITLSLIHILERALRRERQQKKPNYAELCRRFLADEADFSRENLQRLGIEKAYENEDFEECVLQLKNTIV